MRWRANHTNRTLPSNWKQHPRAWKPRSLLRNHSIVSVLRCLFVWSSVRELFTLWGIVHLVDGESVVDKFYYLGDMLSQEGGCEHAILKRIQTGWLKFRELSGLLIEKGIIYTACIWPAMLYDSEIWPAKIEDIRKMQRSEMRMLRWMTGVSLSERKSNECVRNMLAIDDIGEVMRRNRLRWFGHVERRDELCWIKRIETLQVDGDGVKGRPKKRWREVLKEDMREKGLCREDAWDRSRWRKMLWEGLRRGWPQYTGKNNLVKINGYCCCCCCWMEKVDGSWHHWETFGRRVRWIPHTNKLWDFAVFYALLEPSASEDELCFEVEA